MKKSPRGPKASATRRTAPRPAPPATRSPNLPPKPEPRVQWSTTLRPDLIRALNVKAAEALIRTGKRAPVADLVERYIAEGLDRDKRGSK